jgi:hypothetical protein
MQNYNELNELFELTIQDNHGFNGLNGLSGAARILRPEGAKCGDSLCESVALQCIRVIRNQYGICAQPKIRIIRDCNATLCLSEKFVVVKNFVPFVQFVVVR